MPDNDHQDRSTRFSKDGTTAFVRLRVTRKGYEYARHWARFHHVAEPGGTAEDHLEGYLNKALMDAMHDQNWQCPPEIKALYPPPQPLPVGDLDDDLPF